MNNGDPDNPASLRNVDKKHILEVLQTTGTIKAAAQKLEIDRGTLYHAIDRMHLAKVWVDLDAQQSPPQGA